MRTDRSAEYGAVQYLSIPFGRGGELTWPVAYVCK